MIVHLQLVVLYLAPCVALALALWAGWYPGERLIERLRRTSAPRRPRPNLPVIRRRDAHIGGGRVHVARLAGRGPPSLATALDH